jgi:hypothetical protein
MMNLTQNLTFPDRFHEGNPIKTDDDFDANSYLSVLNHLSIETGYELDFVYFRDGVGGKPLVYARKTDQAPYETYAEFTAVAGEPSYWEGSYGYLEHAHDCMALIKTDDTEVGK